MAYGDGTIHVNYEGVDSSSLTINSMLSAFDGSNAQLESLFKPLKATFQGNAAEEGNRLVTQLENELREFKIALNNVRTAIQESGGRAGTVHDVDKAQAVRFLAIG